MPLNFPALNPLLKAQYANKIKNPMAPPAAPSLAGIPSAPAAPAAIAPPMAMKPPTAGMPKAQSFSHMADMIKAANPGHNGTLDKVQNALSKKEDESQKFADSMRQRKVEALRGIIKGGK